MSLRGKQGFTLVFSRFSHDIKFSSVELPFHQRASVLRVTWWDASGIVGIPVFRTKLGFKLRDVGQFLAPAGSQIIHGVTFLYPFLSFGGYFGVLNSEKSVSSSSTGQTQQPLYVTLRHFSDICLVKNFQCALPIFPRLNILIQKKKSRQLKWWLDEKGVYQ